MINSILLRSGRNYSEGLLVALWCLFITPEAVVIWQIHNEVKCIITGKKKVKKINVALEKTIKMVQKDTRGAEEPRQRIRCLGVQADL